MERACKINRRTKSVLTVWAMLLFSYTAMAQPIRTVPEKKVTPPVKSPVKPKTIVVEKNKDTDRDGLIDEIDNCPDEKGLAKYQGCPIPDTDGDGVNDEEDACITVKGDAVKRGCPAVQPNSPFLIHDNFSDNRNDWNLRKNEYTNIYIENGRLVIQGLAHNRRYQSLMSTPINSRKDFNLSVTCKVLENPENYNEIGGLLLGITSAADTNKVQLYFSISNSGYYVIGIRWGERQNPIFGGALGSPYINKNFSTNTLKIQKTDTEFLFYINNHLVNKIPFDKRVQTHVAGCDRFGTGNTAFSDFKVEGTGR